MRKVNAKIDTSKGKLIYDNGVAKLNYMRNSGVSHFTVDYKKIPEEVLHTFKEMIQKILMVFADPNISLPYNTNVVARIHTTTEDPIYTKSY